MLDALLPAVEAFDANPNDAWAAAAAAADAGREATVPMVARKGRASYWVSAVPGWLTLGRLQPVTTEMISMICSWKTTTP